ncbi:MAG: hypothetical protein KU38_07410 [Sulfurovum sp. FS08-3]|nr:MAG: hypothetical protein KU38_07410 [Sulfurovum sp. FS08-3]
MNWLAHIFLSKQTIDCQLGNYLADPLKCQVWDGASRDMCEGMRIHQIIDSYTDSHPMVSISKARLRKKGLLKPVIIDLTYDYLLTKHWERFSYIPKVEFLNTFNYNGYHRALELPTLPQELVLNLIKNDRLNRYNTLEQLRESFGRIDDRLSIKLREKETASGYFDDVVENLNGLEGDFLEFFYQLCEYLSEKLELSHIR